MIFRELANSILQRGASKNYKIAVGYINRAGRLAKSIDQWNNHDDHESYLRAIRETHPRKTAFWSKMK